MHFLNYTLAVFIFMFKLLPVLVKEKTLVTYEDLEECLGPCRHPAPKFCYDKDSIVGAFFFCDCFSCCMQKHSPSNWICLTGCKDWFQRIWSHKPEKNGCVLKASNTVDAKQWCDGFCSWKYVSRHTLSAVEVEDIVKNPNKKCTNACKQLMGRGIKIDYDTIVMQCKNPADCIAAQVTKIIVTTAITDSLLQSHKGLTYPYGVQYYKNDNPSAPFKINKEIPNELNHYLRNFFPKILYGIKQLPMKLTLASTDVEFKAGTATTLLDKDELKKVKLLIANSFLALAGYTEDVDSRAIHFTLDLGPCFHVNNSQPFVTFEEVPMDYEAHLKFYDSQKGFLHLDGYDVKSIILREFEDYSLQQLQLQALDNDEGYQIKINGKIKLTFPTRYVAADTNFCEPIKGCTPKLKDYPARCEFSMNGIFTSKNHTAKSG